MEKVDRKWQIRFKVIRKERMGLATLHKPCTRENDDFGLAAAASKVRYETIMELAKIG